MSRDLIISCMALRKLPDWLPWAGLAPQLLEWPGVPTESGHPSWQRAARAMRDADGRLLPTLLRRYSAFLGHGLDDAGRIAALGFSAGSNSGLRELLRHPEDRARIDFVGAVDGLHPTLRVPRHSVRRFADDPTTLYADWQRQMGPFAETALSAAYGAGVIVATASEVIPASPQVAPTATALASLYAHVARQVQATAPAVPATYPPRASSPELRAGELYPTPTQIRGAGDFVALWYPGGDRRAHELQAWVVVPDLLRAWLVPAWGGPSPGLVSHSPEPARTPGPPRTVSGLPSWTAPATAMTAAAACAALQ